jgi:hypothetical protein
MRDHHEVLDQTQMYVDGLGFEYTARIRIDMQRLKRRLFSRALSNRTHKARQLRGIIEVGIKPKDA